MADGIDMVPAIVPIRVYAGDSFAQLITVSDPSFTSGCAWTAQIRTTRDAATVDTSFTITPDGSGGATMSLTAAQTQALGAGAVPVAGTGVVYSGVYDVQISKPGFTRTMIQGTLTVVLDITRAP